MILVTGGAGFIGANFILNWLTHSDEVVINLDKLTYAGNLNNLSSLKNDARHIFVHADINDRDTLEQILKSHQPRAILHFAAESHVDNSISGPEAFIKTNVLGTFNLLDTARKLWISAPNQYNEAFQNARFHHVSTDEVYGTLGETGLFEETTPYAPNSPYSASKAGSDMIVRSYFHTYGMNVVTTNCSNNYGPKQHNEKLIPTIIRKAIMGENIPIYGDGKNVRDWLYVLDHCKGIELAFKTGKSGETYNIGGRNERNNLQIVDRVCAILDELKPKASGSYKDQITFVKDRPGHDLRYAIDATKIENELGWKADENFDTGIVKTIEWYLGKFAN
jgi:dTDP-glucose 4,6-dehydratase